MPSLTCKAGDNIKEHDELYPQYPFQTRNNRPVPGKQKKQASGFHSLFPPLFISPFPSMLHADYRNGYE